ncbi:hypothetical protein FNF31_05947 [Cafeteria roenbergensis]|nr:hypothetical protein FNF31_05947 [Cafeteria roenbergensis]
MCAAAGGYRGIGRLLLNRGARLDAKDHDGNSALVWAIWNGKIEMARMLLDFGAELEAKRHDGCTPVMVAASCGMADAVSMLVVRGADLDATAFDGEDAVQICTDERCKQLLCSARRGRRWRRRRALVTWRH